MAAQARLLFARHFFKQPLLLASIIPSSRYVVRRLLERIDWTEARVVVEYGPGIGNVTREMLRRLRPDGILLALELNPDFVEYLKREYDDPRLRVVHASAADVRKVLTELGLPRANYIVSGIPFTTMPDGVRKQVMSESRHALEDGGEMIVYQFLRTVRPYLRRIFGRVEEEYELLNILPTRLYYCQP